MDAEPHISEEPIVRLSLVIQSGLYQDLAVICAKDRRNV